MTAQQNSPDSGMFVPGRGHTLSVEADPAAHSELIGAAMQVALDFAALGEEPAPAIPGAERVGVRVVRSVHRAPRIDVVAPGTANRARPFDDPVVHTKVVEDGPQHDPAFARTHDEHCRTVGGPCT